MKNSNNITTGDISLSNNSVSNGGSVGVDVRNHNEDRGLSEEILTAVPYIIHESTMAREERHIKRLIIALIAAIATIIATNIGWLTFLSQYDFSEEWVEVDSSDGGNANYIGQNGDIYNGEYQG